MGKMIPGFSTKDLRFRDLQSMPKITNGHMQHKPYKNDFGRILNKKGEKYGARA